MPLRLLTLVVMVLVLALPHPGRHWQAAAADHVMLQDHAAGMGHDVTGGNLGSDRSDPLCIAVCLGAPLAVVPLAKQPFGTAVALWTGLAAAPPRALAAPAVPARPPNPAALA